VGPNFGAGILQADVIAALEEALDTGARFEQVAHSVREDGYWIDSGENDNAIVQTLVRNSNAVGVFGFSFLDQNRDKIKAAAISGTAPTFESISDESYPVARSLYIYIKKPHVSGNVPNVPSEAIKGYALEFTSEAAMGLGGYLGELGLITLPEEQRRLYRDAVENMTPYTQ
jgi:phosphate transport system substrate-binding protein